MVLTDALGITGAETLGIRVDDPDGSVRSDAAEVAEKDTDEDGVGEIRFIFTLRSGCHIRVDLRVFL